MSRQNHWIFAFLCVYEPNRAAHATPVADAVAYQNFGSFRHSNLADHSTTVTRVVAATPAYVGIAAVTCRLPILTCKIFDKLSCFGIHQVPGANNGAAAYPQVNVRVLGFVGIQLFPDELNASSQELYFDAYYQLLPVGHNTQFASNPYHIAGAEPVFVFSTLIRHGF